MAVCQQHLQYRRSKWRGEENIQGDPCVSDVPQSGESGVIQRCAACQRWRGELPVWWWRESDPCSECSGKREFFIRQKRKSDEAWKYWRNRVWISIRYEKSSDSGCQFWRSPLSIYIQWQRTANPDDSRWRKISRSSHTGQSVLYPGKNFRKLSGCQKQWDGKRNCGTVVHVLWICRAEMEADRWKRRIYAVWASLWLWIPPGS